MLHQTAMNKIKKKKTKTIAIDLKNICLMLMDSLDDTRIMIILV